MFLGVVYVFRYDVFEFCDILFCIMSFVLKVIMFIC